MRSPDLLCEDTIVAEATVPGQGGLSLIRLSGPLAFETFQRLVGGKKSHLQHARAHLHRVPGLDDFIAVAYHSPRSFTGENVVEISCHGNPVIVKRFIEGLVSVGARLARPGEFSFRAVLHGKMSVSEAERMSRRIFARDLWELEFVETAQDGTRLFRELLVDLQEALADLESSIEFGEGPGPDLERIRKKSCRLKDLADSQKVLSRLPLVLLYGPVNAGKSTLFNAILGYDRAIVHEEPGTTRDYLETSVQANGVSFRLVDSAGVRTAEGPAESMGVEHTQDLLSKADVVVAFDGVPVESVGSVIRVHGKADLSIPDRDMTALAVSGKTRKGVDMLLDTISGVLVRLREDSRPECWISERLAAVADQIREGMDSLSESLLPEVQAIHLGEIVRTLEQALQVPPADLYGLIFSRFCIGK